LVSAAKAGPIRAKNRAFVTTSGVKLKPAAIRKPSGKAEAAALHGRRENEQDSGL
jgi:hypothetical protein